MSEKSQDLLHEALECVRIAEQIASISTDWNLDEMEIDGKMVRTWSLHAKFEKCLNRAERAGILPTPSAKRGKA